MVAMAIGSIMPPAKPWTMRPTTSTQKAGARPHNTDDEAVKTASAVVQTRRMVKRFSRKLAIGVAMPLASE
jgi:hypothetical protein